MNNLKLAVGVKNLPRWPSKHREHCIDRIVLLNGLRGVWLRVHRWLALSAGWILIFSGLSGAALVVTPALDRWANPQLFQARSDLAPGQAGVTLESVLRSARQEFGDGANLVFRPARAHGETLEVRVRGGWRGTLYLDPATGAEQGRRARCTWTAPARPFWPGWRWPTCSCSSRG
ncbi:hypothetical protein G6F68_014741 [Rhizopus microsporus]|nr:hypothetical protein G6F68_014741 [Rhizopus microsporus]